MSTNDDLIEQMARAARATAGFSDGWDETAEESRTLWRDEITAALAGASPVELAAYAVERIIADRGWRVEWDDNGVPFIDDDDPTSGAADWSVANACLALLRHRARRVDPMCRLEAAVSAVSDRMPHDDVANRLTIELNAAFAALKTNLEDEA